MKTITLIGLKKEEFTHTGSGVPIYEYDVDGKRVFATKVEIRERYIWGKDEEYKLIED
jgi:hypothetical protein